MGARGPAPRPAEVLRLEGNWRGKHRADTLQPEQIKLACPSNLSKAAKKKWRELYPRLFRLGMLTELDGESLAMACEAWAAFMEATGTLASEGSTFTTEKGYVGTHPAVARQQGAWSAWLKFAAVFGLAPSLRTRIPAPDTEEPKRGVASRQRGGIPTRKREGGVMSRDRGEDYA